jgi:hypothetical protein
METGAVEQLACSGPVDSDDGDSVPFEEFRLKPLCMFAICLFILLITENPFPSSLHRHPGTSQRKGFSFVWTRLCVTTAYGVGNRLWQYGQRCVFDVRRVRSVGETKFCLCTAGVVVWRVAFLGLGFWCFHQLCLRCVRWYTSTLPFRKSRMELMD